MSEHRDYQLKDNAKRPASEAEATAEAIKRAMRSQDRQDAINQGVHARQFARLNGLANKGAGKSRKS
jgi:hypothetical protein